MRIWLYIFSLCLTLSPICMLANSEHGIVLTLSQTECYPGDVIELHAQMTRADYAEFELKLPKVAALHFVAQQQSPITYSKGFYWQSAVWIFQPVRSGSIEWSGIRAQLKHGEIETEYELPPLKLEVSPYAITEDDATPEALPLDSELNTDGQHPLWLYLLIGIGGLGILYSALRLQSKSPVSEAAPKASLAELQQALKSDTVPVALIEQLLADPANTFSRELRLAMEAAVYKPQADPQALRTAIEQEVQS
ncbi:hypothetical protein ACWPKS_05125 [Coraliomargarita sp. W4R72]